MRPALFSLLSLAAALNFEWSYEGEKYWATEVSRISKCKDPARIASHISDDGLGYFSVGEVDWPQFSEKVQSEDLAPGAYVVTNMNGQLVIAKVYQVKPDPAIAFMEGSIPVGNDKFAPFQSGGIPVPPAIGGDGPLAGLRFAVKDIFHVNGLKTSGGSRAYYSAYGPQNYTNEVVEKSLAGGAQMVGKTKTIAFALGTPRNGWEVDYQDPWNVRGDGYQTTGGSSSGSGAAVTAYDWLDFAIGSDTGGSVRFPARFAGFYGYKPTHGIYNLTGILVAIAEQDTPGHMARSPDVFVRVYRQWAKGTPLEKNAPGSFPTKLQYWADEAPLAQPDARDMVAGFFSRVEAALGFSDIARVNVTESWHRHVTNQSMNEYMYSVYQDQNSAQTWDQIGEPLYEAYAAQNDGAFPPADPVVNMTWADGTNATTRARYGEAVRRRERFAAWFNTHVVPGSAAGTDTCTDSIVAHTLHAAPSTVKYDQTPFRLVSGWYNGLQASFAGTPEIVVPVGQVRYRSPFTRRADEWQAVTVAFMAARGCDGVLFELVERLAAAGLIAEVRSGKTAYPVD